MPQTTNWQNSITKVCDYRKFFFTNRIECCMLNDAGEVSAHFARIFHSCKRCFAHDSFGAGEIPDRWYSPRTPKGSRTGEIL